MYHPSIRSASFPNPPSTQKYNRHETEESEDVQEVHAYLFDFLRVSGTISNFRHLSFDSKFAAEKLTVLDTVDSEMCRAANSFRIDIAHQFQIVLQGQIKPSKCFGPSCSFFANAFSVITQCCIEELYREGSSQQGAVDIAKSFERRRCNHREPISGVECLRSVIGVQFFIRGDLNNEYLQESLINIDM